MARKLPDVITEEEIVSILNKTKKNKYKLAFMLGFYQGMRVSEVAHLLPEDVDRTSYIIRIRQGKGAKDRDIPIIKPLLLRDREVVLAIKHLPINVGVRALQNNFKDAAREVLGKDLNFHTLRHSCATWLLNKKRWDIRQVQRFLGHSRIQTTEIYAHVRPGDLVRLEWGELN